MWERQLDRYAIDFDRLDANLGECLAMALHFLVLLLPLEVEDEDLGVATIADDFGGDGGAGGLDDGAGLTGNSDAPSSGLKSDQAITLRKSNRLI